MGSFAVRAHVVGAAFSLQSMVVSVFNEQQRARPLEVHPESPVPGLDMGHSHILSSSSTLEGKGCLYDHAVGRPLLLYGCCGKRWSDVRHTHSSRPPGTPELRRNHKSIDDTVNINNEQ